MAVNNNLYPPLVETYAPTFLIDSGITNQDVCIIPFSLSAYNTTADVGENAVQVIVSYQNTNKNALSLSEWPSGVMLTSANFKEDGRTGEIHIYKKDLEGNAFNINQYYKVQIRFTGTKEVLVNGESKSAIANMPSNHGYDTWLAEYQAAFSEWSTVVLARGISTPQLELYTFDKTQYITQFNTFNVHVAGELTFANSAETDSLKYYKIKLYSEDNILTGNEIFMTENIYNEGSSYSKNEINYLLKYALKEGENYFLVVEYETQTGFAQSQEYNFIVLIDSSSEQLDINISVEADNEEGRVKVTLFKNFLSPFDTESLVIISRANSKDNFGIWEDMHIVKVKEVKDTRFSYIWYDYTAESGTLYRYAVQKVDSTTTKRSLMNKTEQLMTISPEYWFLVANNEQFKIKYNPKMSSFKHVISEAKVDTIGSKYPFIKRNGYVEYRSFPISGTISVTADEAETLFSKSEDYRDSEGNYIAMDEYHVLDLYDINLEKQFREKVLKFFYRNDVKLFKSATEGNILVKLMDITFTPNAVLGNLIYDFSCTAHEIAEFSVENCDAYGIQTINSNKESISRGIEVIPSSTSGILDSENIPANTNIATLIEEQLQEEGYRKIVQSITQLKIQINSDPYLIQEVDGVPRKADANADLNSAYLGYIVKLNDVPFVISFEGIYNLSGANVDVSSVVFIEETDAQIQYVADILTIKEQESSISSISYFQKLGQLWGVFNPEENLYSKIANKYYEDVEGQYIQKLISVNSVRVDAEEGTVFFLRTSTDEELKRYVVPEGNLLTFYDDNSIIEEMYFYGKDGEATPSPVEAAINYECDIMKGYYGN